MGSQEGGGPQTDKTPAAGQFFWITTFGIAFYQFNLSTLGSKCLKAAQENKNIIFCLISKDCSEFPLVKNKDMLQKGYNLRPASHLRMIECALYNFSEQSVSAKKQNGE